MSSSVSIGSRCSFALILPKLASLFHSCPEGLGLACPNAKAKQDFYDAVQRGDIWWHAFPHNAELASMNSAQATSSHKGGMGGARPGGEPMSIGTDGV